MHPPADDEITLDVLQSNVRALAVWRMCRKPMLAAGFGAVPEELDAPEIRTVATAHEVEFDAALLAKVRALDSGFVAEARRVAGDRGRR